MRTWPDMIYGLKAKMRAAGIACIADVRNDFKEFKRDGVALQSVKTDDLSRDPNALQKAQNASLRIVFDGKGLSISTFRRE